MAHGILFRSLRSAHMYIHGESIPSRHPHSSPLSNLEVLCSVGCRHTDPCTRILRLS